MSVISYIIPGSTDYGYTGTEVEPVTLTEVKRYLRIGFNDDDEDITAMITAAREWVEDVTGVTLVTRTVTCRVHLVSGQSVELPSGPQQSEPVVTPDSDASETYTVSTGPYVTISGCGDYSVSYTAGYDSIPGMLKLAIKAKVAALYERRGENESSPESSTAYEYLRAYKRISLWL